MANGEVKALMIVDRFHANLSTRDCEDKNKDYVMEVLSL